MGSIEPVGIILRDYKGDETIHYGKEQLEVNSTDGGTQKFIRDDLIAEPVEKTVELDFSGGDMVVTPDDGQVFSSVNIPVPNNLVPENIGEGWNIAGITGTLKGSGGEGMPYTWGTFTRTGSVQTITHGLGVVPDFLMVTEMGSASGYTYTIRTLYGISKAFGTLVNVSLGNVKYYTGSSNYNYLKGEFGGFLDTTANTAFLHNVNETTFNVPAALDAANSTYLWFAVGGLA